MANRRKTKIIKEKQEDTKESRICRKDKSNEVSKMPDGRRDGNMMEKLDSGICLGVSTKILQEN